MKHDAAVIRGTSKLSGYGEIFVGRTGVYCETNFSGNRVWGLADRDLVQLPLP